MWWDIHLSHRKSLVKYRKFPSDEEEYEDVLEEIQQEKEIRSNRKEDRK